MNIFKKLISRSGKMALSTMQAVGLAAAVGVGGIAIGSYLTSSNEDNTSFNVYNPDPVVYVSGANTGGYVGGMYYGGEKNTSAMQVSAKAVNRMDRQAQAQQAAQEMEESSQGASSVSASDPAAYQMGMSDGGLGMGGNFAGDGENPLGGIQSAMGGMQDMMSGAAGAAQAQAAAQGGAAAALASASMAKSGGGSGASSGMSFTVQDSGKNAGSGAGGVGRGGVAGGPSVSGSAQEQAARMLEGARIKGRSSFGPSDGLRGNKDASIMGGSTANGDGDLEFIRKRSVDAALNRNRAANEGSRAFMASTQISGGLMVTGDGVTTNQSQGSRDFDNSKEISGIRPRVQAAVGDPGDEDNGPSWWNMLWTLLWTFSLAMLIAGLVHAVINIPLIGRAAAALGTAAIGVLLKTMFDKAQEYADMKGSDAWMTVYMIAAVMIASSTALAWAGNKLITKLRSIFTGPIGELLDKFEGMSAGAIWKYFKNQWGLTDLSESVKNNMKENARGAAKDAVNVD